ncbi:hypothetical protein [Paracidovorax wautersii]|nr:hypothetical protein [Paracidovorax wautersii]
MPHPVSVKAATAAVLPLAEATDLKPSHYKRLRFIFNLGRPAEMPKVEGHDAVLVTAGLVEVLPQPESRWGHPSIRLALTPAGDALVRRRIEERRGAVAVHHDLASRLAHWLREKKGKMTLEDGTFNRVGEPFYFDERTGITTVLPTTVRVDVFAAAYTPTARLAKLETFEVKRSVSDFRSELRNPAKSQASMALAEASWFVTPAALIDPAEVPAGFGLLEEVAPGRFMAVKRPKRKAQFIPAPDTLMTLIYRRPVFPDAALY